MINQISMKRFAGELSGDEFGSVKAELAKAGFHLLLSSANKAYCDALGVDQTPLAEPATTIGLSAARQYEDGDLIPSDDWSELVFVGFWSERVFSEAPQMAPRSFRRRGKLARRLDVGSIHNGVHSTLDGVTRVIERTLGQTDADPRWNTLSWWSDQIADLLDKGVAKRATFTPDEVLVADQLKIPDRRKLITAIKASGGMPESEAIRFGCNEAQVTTLQNAGLLAREFVVICRRNSRMLNRLPSREAIEAMDRQGARCATCGSRLTDEKLEQFLIPTDLAKNLVDHSRWMSIVLQERLADLGVPLDSVALEILEGPGEVDALADIDGRVVLFELKDKDFSIGDAYPVSGRVAQYHPAYIAIVSTSRIGPEVREYFEKVKPEAPIIYVEGLDSLGPQLEIVVGDIRGQRAIELLKRFDTLAIRADISSLLAPKLGLKAPPVEQRGLLGAGTLYPPVAPLRLGVGK